MRLTDRCLAEVRVVIAMSTLKFGLIRMLQRILQIIEVLPIEKKLPVA
jgi:hypothetical protein